MIISNRTLFIGDSFDIEWKVAIHGLQYILSFRKVTPCSIRSYTPSYRTRVKIAFIGIISP